MAAVLDPSAFSTAEQTAIFTAAKAEYLRRLQTGSVQTGSSAGQSFGMNLLTQDALISTINAFAQSLGMQDAITVVAPNFAGTAWSWPHPNA